MDGKWWKMDGRWVEGGEKWVKVVCGWMIVEEWEEQGWLESGFKVGVHFMKDRRVGIGCRLVVCDWWMVIGGG